MIHDHGLHAPFSNQHPAIAWKKTAPAIGWQSNRMTPGASGSEGTSVGITTPGLVTSDKYEPITPFFFEVK